jgi:predicted double-glycine peptidase
MIALLFTYVAIAITASAIFARHEPVDRPANQFELQMAVVGGGPSTQAAPIEPFSELKFRHIVHQAYDYSCGSAALVTVMNFYLDINVTEQEAMDGMLERGEKEKIIERRGFSLLDMKRYVASLGVESAGFKAEVKDLLELEHPAIVPINFGGSKHFVVLRGVRDGMVYLADPSAGNILFSIKYFATLWDRNTLFIIYPPKNRPVENLLALTDKELGLTDMDRIKDRAILTPLGNAAQMDSITNGFNGVAVFHR